MPFERLDTTLNSDLGSQLARINRMFEELYGAGGGGGAVSGTTGTFSGALATDSSMTAGALRLDTGTKTASATAGAATLNKDAGVITSEALSTAAGATYTLTLTNSAVAAADQVFASVQNGTNSAGAPIIESVTPGSGSVVIVVRNIHSADALNGTIKIAFAVLKN